MTNSWSGVLLVTGDGNIIAMHRDDKPGLRDAGCYGIFGGAIEDGETPLEAAVREIGEETNLKVSSDDFVLFKIYKQKRNYLDTVGTLYVYALKNVDPERLKIYEGQGIKVLKNSDDPNIAGDVREAFVDWFAERVLDSPRSNLE